MVPFDERIVVGRPTPIRVMIVDDSIVARAVLARMLESQRDFVIAAQASSGADAIAALASHDIDLILLDLEMPGMGGLEALPRLLAEGRGARVLVLSAAAGTGAAATVAALSLGAADTLLKPAAGGLIGDSFSTALIERLRKLADAAAPPPPRREALRPTTAGPRLGLVDCLAIGASTGGVHALADFFAALPRDFPAPILVTQHLPAPFMPHFARQLCELAHRPAVLAASGMPLVPGRILLAPGDAHISLVELRGQVHVRLQRKPVLSGCMPSVDPMFAAVAATFGPRGLGVVLSGMGRDGLTGARLMVDAGAKVCAQDAGSSVVWGMPGVVAEAGLATAIATPSALAELIGRADARARASAWI